MDANELRALPPITVYESDYEPEDAYAGGGKNTTIRREDGKFIVEGEWLVNLMGQINFSDWESMNFLQRVLQKSGVFALLEENGCRDGDTVTIYDYEFDFVK
jgi:GTP-binding protein